MATPALPPPPPGQPLPQPSRLQITVDAEAFIFLAGLCWLFWEKVLRSRVVRHLDGVLTPVEEERALNDLLAQIALLAGASRVLLCAFHNGNIGPGGYHLTKISAVNTYLADGCIPMAAPIRDLPIGRVMTEMEQMLAAYDSGAAWVVTTDGPHLPVLCRDHLQRNGIAMMMNRLVMIENLPIGILSAHYCDENPSSPLLVHGATEARLVEGLYDRIAVIMRRRVIHPSPLRKLLYRLTGNSQVNPLR